MDLRYADSMWIRTTGLLKCTYSFASWYSPFGMHVFVLCIIFTLFLFVVVAATSFQFHRSFMCHISIIIISIIAFFIACDCDPYKTKEGERERSWAIGMFLEIDA